jgi:hypothetical protein
VFVKIVVLAFQLLQVFLQEFDALVERVNSRRQGLKFLPVVEISSRNIDDWI